LQDHRSEIEKASGKLIAISADNASDSAALKEKLGLTFPLLSDADLKIATAYGVRQADLDAALPALFVVGADGKVRWERIGDNPADRPTPAELLQALRRAR
jgi:peroxiredoxin